MPRIAIYCGARLGISDQFQEAAADLARTLINANIGIVYGGSQNGLMGVIADTAIACGGEVIGVIPTQFEKIEHAHPNLTKLIPVQTMHERKALMFELSDAAIALPGGPGTLDELIEIYAYNNMGLHHKPCLCLDVNQFWTPLFDLLTQMKNNGFMHQRAPLLRAENSIEALHLIRQHWLFHPKLMR